MLFLPNSAYAWQPYKEPKIQITFIQNTRWLYSLPLFWTQKHYMLLYYSGSLNFRHVWNSWIFVWSLNGLFFKWCSELQKNCIQIPDRCCVYPSEEVPPVTASSNVLWGQLKYLRSTYLFTSHPTAGHIQRGFPQAREAHTRDPHGPQYCPLIRCHLNNRQLSGIWMTGGQVKVWYSSDVSAIQMFIIKIPTVLFLL